MCEVCENVRKFFDLLASDEVELMDELQPHTIEYREKAMLIASWQSSNEHLHLLHFMSVITSDKKSGESIEGMKERAAAEMYVNEMAIQGSGFAVVNSRLASHGHLSMLFYDKACRVSATSANLVMEKMDEIIHLMIGRNALSIPDKSTLAGMDGVTPASSGLSAMIEALSNMTMLQDVGDEEEDDGVLDGGSNVFAEYVDSLGEDGD